MSHRLFISYSRKDAAFASQLAADLRQHGADVWIDVSDIQAGKKWSSAVQQGLDESTLMILILSRGAMDSPNVEDEWQYFLDEQKPIIPILLEPAKIHFQLKRIQYVDFHGQAYHTAFGMLRHELGKIGLTLVERVPQSPPAVPKPAPIAASILPPLVLKPATATTQKSKFTLPLLEWINIPKGKVILEKNGITYAILPFAIAKYPVTNAQFQAFIDDGGYREDRYWTDLAKRESAPRKPSSIHPTHPRETVNWYEALAFCRWLTENTGLAVALPTEMQWQWAAVSDKDWNYPYGNTFDKDKGNTEESGIGKTTPVDRYPRGASPFGVVDMSGNVWEWCLNEHLVVANDEINNKRFRVLRGGAFDLDQDFARATSRNNLDPAFRHDGIGFRLMHSGSVK